MFSFKNKKQTVENLISSDNWNLTKVKFNVTWPKRSAKQHQLSGAASNRTLARLL